MAIQDSDWFLRHPKPEEVEKVKEFLTSIHLPTEKIEDQFDNFLILFDSDSSIIGCVGLEIYQNFGLVRSLAVTETYQNKSLGSFLLAKLEQEAKTKNLDELYLLTETAEKFFKNRGYTVVERQFVPIEIQNSYEYSSSCKKSAIVMKKASF